MQSNPDSTYYSRPDIDYNALNINNNIILELGSNLGFPSDPDQYLTSRTTGNGLIYLTGSVVINSTIISGDVIAILPISRPPIKESRFLASIRGVLDPAEIVVHFVSGEIRATKTSSDPQIIDFDGIVYLQKFPV